MGCRELRGGVHTNPDTDTDATGFQTHCVGVSVGKGKICVGVGQCEQTIRYQLQKYGRMWLHIFPLPSLGLNKQQTLNFVSLQIKCS